MIKAATAFKFGILGLFALGSPGFAGPNPNLVTNGDFEDSSPVNTGAFPTSAGGIGQVGPVVNLAGWARTIIQNPESQGFAFVIDSSADNRNPGGVYPNQGGGFPTINTQASSTNAFLWGPDYSPSPQANGFTGSPNGGKFMALSGGYGRTKITQLISGLTAGESYSFSFEFAGSQFTDSSVPTSQELRVGLGPDSNTLGPWTNPGMGFTPWATHSSTFTSGGSSFELSFEGISSTDGGMAMLLLDNIQIRQNSTPTPVPGPLPVAGAAAAFAWSRRLRRRLRQRD